MIVGGKDTLSTKRGLRRTEFIPFRLDFYPTKSCVRTDAPLIPRLFAMDAPLMYVGIESALLCQALLSKRKGSVTMKRLAAAGIALLVLSTNGQAQEHPTPLENYRKLKCPPSDENFDKGWQDRVVAEFAVVNDADRDALRAALKDKNPFIRSIAAHALGIRGDRHSGDALAELAKNDTEYFVRIRAVESLGLLKLHSDVIELAKKDRNLGVVWVANPAADQARSATDFAAEIRLAYKAGIKSEEIGSAQLGQRAPDFTAQTSDGKPFQLASVLGKKPLAIYFAAFDG